MESQLAQQQKSLENQLGIFRGLLEKELTDPATVYLGDGYFVSLPVAEAKDFLNRKIGRLEQELSTMNHLSGINDEGLPILDIVEELDDDDQIINSSLNSTGLGAQLAQIKLKNKEKSPRSENILESGVVEEATKDSTNTASTSSANGKNTNSSSDLVPTVADLSPSANPAISELPSFDRNIHELDTEAGNLSEYEFIEDVSLTPCSHSSEDTSQGEFRDIDPAEILELELMNDDESDEEPIDFDFDNLEEEGESDHLFVDNEYASENESESENENDDDEFNDGDDYDDDDYDDDDYDEIKENACDSSRRSNWMSRAGSLFPQNESTRKLIEAHLKKQTKSKASVPTKSAPSSAKESLPCNKSSLLEPEAKTTKTCSHVHFADSVDVRLFETTSKERKFTPADLTVKKPSRFRALRQPVSSNTPLSKSSNKAGLSAAAAAAAAVVNRSPSKSAVNNQIKERRNPKSPQEHALPSLTNDKTITSDSGPDGHQKDSELNVELPNTSSTENGASQSNKDGTKEDGKKNQLSAILTPAQIKAKIASDAQTFYEQSFVPDEDFLTLHDTKSDNHSGTEDSKISQTTSQADAKADDRPVVSSSIIERIEENAEDGYSENDDPVVDMKEIKREYQRLRQKMIYESGGYIKKPIEKEFEPINPEGEPKKVSRFKAARIG